MELLSPWFLLALAPVAAAAIWSLLRPARQLVVVGSLSLWDKAAASLSSSARRRTRRVGASWACLLAGALLAVLACARPAWFTEAPARRLAIVAVPSAELAAGGGMDRLRGGVNALLERLSPADRVQLVLPDVLGGATDWLTAAEARSPATRSPGRWPISPPTRN